MLKTFLLSSVLAVLLTSKENCTSKKQNAGCYKGRLEIKAICFNYTIKVLEGNIDTSKIVAKWTDENTGKSYADVFALGSPCSFPPDIKEGDEFYFTIKEKDEKQCNICMAYYPTPPKQLAISVSKTPCP